MKCRQESSGRLQRALRARGKRGLALVYAVFAAFVAASMCSMMMTFSLASSRVSAVKRDGGRAQYLAEGAVEAAKKQIQTSIANWTAVPATGNVAIGGHTVTYAIRPTGFSETVTDPSGIQTIVNGYEIEAEGEHAGKTAMARRLVNSEATPLFQYAVFYTNDLEVLPGPDMTLRGRVHSNKNMYLGSNGNTLTLDTNYVHAVGNIYRYRKDDPTQSQGTVTIRKWVQNPFDLAEPSQYFVMKSKSQMSALGVNTPSGYDSQFVTGYDSNGNGSYTDHGDWLPWAPGALSYWQQPASYAHGTGNTVLDSDHGVTEAVTPQIGSIKAYDAMPNGGTGGDFDYDASTGTYHSVASGTGHFKEGYYHDKADLSIIGDPAHNTWKAFNSAGIDISSAVSSAISFVSMYDARQANDGTAKTKVLNVNMGLLASSGKFPSNGLMYAANTGESTGTRAYGVRLSNGSTLPSKLTVVSEDPIYIKGDYNTNAKKGCAVIGDAVNLLSNAWNDSKTHGNLPAATNTTYNVAMVAGNLNTTVGGYNGGLENLPRFHEDWSGKTCTMAGSLVNTWNSQYASSAWNIGGDFYNPPARLWTYDTAFNSVANLPPFTPVAVSAHDIVSW
jgi:Tfp pilus assembly protein PilX